MNWLKRKIQVWLEIDRIDEHLDAIDETLEGYIDDAEKYTDDTVESAIAQHDDDLSICGEDIVSVVMNLSSRVDDIESNVSILENSMETPGAKQCQT